MKKKNPTAGFGELGKLMGDMWSKLSEKEKLTYQKKADKDKERYNAEKEAYVPPTPPVPKDWCEAQDPNTGKTYYYNRKTSETTWSRPEAAPLKLKKKKKDPDAPKRAKSAYFFFMDAVRGKTKADNPTATIGELGKLMGAAWSKIADKDKAKYEKEAAADKERYERAKAEYERTKAA